MRRLLVPSSALVWGLQLALLNPSLALLLVALYDATPGEVGAVLAIYNAGGLLASLVVPAWADRRGDYLAPMLGCALLTVALAGALSVVTTLPLVLVALVVLGGPAGVGSTLLFAHLKHSGTSPTDVVGTRAVVSLAWVGGPPLATAIIAVFGERAILAAIAVVAIFGVLTTVMLRRSSTREREVRSAGEAPDGGAEAAQAASALTSTPPRGRVVVVLAAFVALQATNATVVAVMALFVTATLGLDMAWAGIALGVAAALEIPALLVIARLEGRYSRLALITSGAVAGIVYYVGAAFVTLPWQLLALQVLNAWFFAAVAGTGLTLFQAIVARPGLASGLYANTRRVGAIISGPLIALGAATSLGYGAVFLACAALTAAALALLLALVAVERRPGHPSGPSALSR